ncbi:MULTISPECIES: hypothetical protein [unclassified Curtobacterium]|uniref:hypothetical protein n=1 Tax=unclassified Curtobacterium TaxID=257496 RepID=UPI00188CD414|nr:MULTISPECIES: hypothetical protein [unclassified Curtobacterium]MBF4591703.1 hypothetical protein [Curtobacterium sp. VKM Ac-1395]MCY1692969.1 hypothetical protein [Curtobacterium sp. SL109]
MDSNPVRPLPEHDTLEAQGFAPSSGPAPSVRFEETRTAAAAPSFRSSPDAAPAAEMGDGTAAPAQKPRRNADPKGQNPDDLLKVTFDVRREDRDAFNAAVKAAVLFEGHKNAGSFLAYIYNRERERLEQDYNQGRPFERRDKPLPRGGSFQKQS